MSQRFVRYQKSSEIGPQFGFLNGDLTGGTITPLGKAPWDGVEPAGGEFSARELSDKTLLAPVIPSKIICVGLNYHAHVKASYSADEAPERPLLFMKPSSSIIGPEARIVLPPVSERVDYEAELGVVIGKTACKVSVEEAANHIFGLTCVNDVTARDLQKLDGQWTRAKGFDTFCPVGPWIVTDINYDDILIEGILNDEVKQSGRTSQMIFLIPQLISYISSIMTLSPGDLISTGTPAGIAPMKSGDTIEVRVENVGTLRNHIVSTED
ncbi:MAG: fumarylacetoacetate hydrolase family protein [candidate division Zixibacteria bacterium]|nr:fumarylacetoacetate hydrolase family protein [candidate division Zixibacteria bacterium]